MRSPGIEPGSFVLLQAIIRLLMESVYVLAHLWAPFIPMGADKIFEKLATAPRPLKDLSETFENLEPGHPIPTSKSVSHISLLPRLSG